MKKTNVKTNKKFVSGEVKISKLNFREAEVENISIYSTDELLKLHGFVPSDDWIINSIKTSRWLAKNPDGEHIPMVSSEIRVVPNSSVEI